MTAHRLQARGIEFDVEPKVIAISVTSPSRGVAILDVVVGSRSSPAPLHWLAGDWSKPPLDVALGPGGQIESVQVVFQDEAVAMTEADVSSRDELGLPSFELDGWPANRYLDVRTDVHAARIASDELLVSIDGDPPTRLVQLGDGLKLGLDGRDHLARLVIGPLDIEQWRMIDAAAS